MDFRTAYSHLNAAQKQAVDAVDGPVLVIAGPGTGKTQLLSLRVANILRQTDASASNILCLTFTESGATNMRERLTRFIGMEASDVTISTYHAFGGDLIKRFPEYFSDLRLENPVDQLSQHGIIQSIVDGLRYDNPLKQTQHHIHDLIATVGEVKRALLTSDDLRAIAQENEQFLQAGSTHVSEIMGALSRMPGNLAKAAPYFEEILSRLRRIVPEEPVNIQFGSLAHLAVRELEIALQDAESDQSSKPLTSWKNAWLAKDTNDRYVLEGRLKNRRIAALADVLEVYESALRKRGLYDFDDMILRSIHAIETNDDLRFSLQEQYQYILLDEFQDTNTAQLKLVSLLTNNPANAGRPNVLAVGDDDQAIYAFQGAQYSNMLDFYQMYEDTTVINLTENYRSHADVLHAAKQIAEQIDERLHHHFLGASKELIAANSSLPTRAQIDRHEFMSDVAEYDWIAERIAALTKDGVPPHEIAVLAPKHKQLEPLVAYLNSRELPVRYEKRENILEASVVRQLLTMARLILALEHGDMKRADSLWPVVLSFDFWQIPLKRIWQFSWRLRDEKTGRTWSEALTDDEYLADPALLLMSIGLKASTEPLETVLDYLIGTQPVAINESGRKLLSPLKIFYTSRKGRDTRPDEYYDTLSHLTVLRAKLREHELTRDKILTLADFVLFADMHEAAGQRIINTSPYAQSADSVELMTVFKAKGLEFEHVFILQALDDTWGETSRGGSNRLSLPANLVPIRRDAVTKDERLRIFFVALTRAKTGLHITSHKFGYSGKATRRLTYLDEQELEDGTHISRILPAHAQTIVTSDHEAPNLETLEHYWHTPYRAMLRDLSLRDILQDRLAQYQLSPTDLGDFIDLENCGPEEFFLRCIFRFPTAPNEHIEFGNAIHETLEWYQHQVEHKQLPLNAVSKQFTSIMQAKKLPEAQLELLVHRGERALEHYLAERAAIYERPAVVERSFRNENVYIGKAHLAGKIDRMEIDDKAKTITVVDYKTGRSGAKPERSIKSFKHMQQLYFYKILIENSRTYKGYTVRSGRLEYIEPDDNGNINTHEIIFKPEQVERTKQLIEAVWRHVIELDIPDVSMYGKSIADVEKFVSAIIDKYT